MVRIQSGRAARIELFKAKGDLKELFSAPNFDFAGQAVVVLGNSPALAAVDLAPLKLVQTIGVNRIGRIFTPNVLLFTDPPILQDEEAFYKAFQGPILTWHNFRPSWIHSAPNARFFNLGPTTAAERWIWPANKKDALIREGTTTAYALQIAVLMGAKAVGMLGVDFSAPTHAQKKENTHFYGDGRPIRSSGGGGFTTGHAAFYSKVPSWAASNRVPVFNLSPFSDTPINKAGWNKLTVSEFVERFA
jgi:hypothetical protein